MLYQKQRTVWSGGMAKLEADQELDLVGLPRDEAAARAQLHLAHPGHRRFLVLQGRRLVLGLDVFPAAPDELIDSRHNLRA